MKDVVITSERLVDALGVAAIGVVVGVGGFASLLLRPEGLSFWDRAPTGLCLVVLGLHLIVLARGVKRRDSTALLTASLLLAALAVVYVIGIGLSLVPVLLVLFSVRLARLVCSPLA